MASPQYVYVMNRLSKTYPGGKQVLKDITLAFLPGAKIGVVGLNGAGKVDAAAHHGGRREGVPRRGLGGGRRHASAFCRRSHSLIQPRTSPAT